MRVRAFSCFVSLAMAAAASAQSTLFTYQGELKSAGQAASGAHDIRFKLFDTAAGGTQVGSTICVNNVQVSDGKFTTPVDFGQQFVTAAQRFIEIEVRADSGLDCANVGGFVVLFPRQLVTATPIATHAKTAFSLAAGDGSPANAVNVDNDGKVGVGTTTPTHTVHIASTQPTLAIQDTDSNGAALGQQVGYVSYRDSGNVERAWVGYGSAGDPDFSIINARQSGDIVLNTLGGGKVGIGTAAPLSALDVRGDIRLGASGQFRAPACEENLRIIRGTIEVDGSIVRGSGFTAQRTDVGKYVITFVTPFAATPTITATAVRNLAEPFTVCIDNIDPPTASQVTLVTYRHGLNDYLSDRFDFIAIGPR